MQLPAPRSDFIGFTDDVVHLATGGQPPLLAAHREAFEAFAADKARGSAGYQHHWAVGAAVKAKLAQLTGVPAADHALVGSASEAIGRVVSSFAWRPGDNAVVADRDYASGRFSILRLARLGVEPRVVACNGWYIDPERLVAACDGRTRLVYVSQVTSLTGQRFDIEWLGAELARRGVALLVDASHALGVVPVDARHADFTVSSGYKFLCATHMGVLAWNRERRPTFEPLSVGWASATDTPAGNVLRLHDDATRAQAGNPNHLDVYLLERSLDYLLGYGIDAIAAHALAIATRLHRGLTDLGLPVVTPAAPGERGTNVVFSSARDAEVVADAADAGILLWAGGGRVRASVHLFNTEADVERYLGWLGEAGVGR
ncbi:MAG: aminotransferase class V-fold PLP-dependent enzyme [Ectothiorhodospiraceae bacterium]|nr:aminotransferase class V-fold PLP-dependent enzyme [Chromatiales bacterium]MCP5154856.1 aminotransferase class V-fold PLP-dependent enzyme [Ectothiorhodospiraceae bacterium]